MPINNMGCFNLMKQPMLFVDLFVLHHVIPSMSIGSTTVTYIV